MTRSSWTALLAPLALLAASTVVAQQSGTSADGRYMIKFRDFNGAARAVASAGGQVIHELGPQRTIAAWLPDQALNGLRNNPNVEYVEVDPRRYLMSQTTPYGIPMVQATDGSLTGTSQNSVTVCIIDSGYYEAHEDLPKMFDGSVTGDVTGSVTGTDVSGTGSWRQDSCGHGTHVAGTIAAVDNSTGVLGVSSNGTLKLHIVKVFDGADCKWTYASNLVSALNVCRSNVPASQRLVVSMSLGGSFSSTTENSAFQNAYSAGVLSVAAAGNDGNTRKSYPASYPSVISVAAVDRNGVHADFSQRNSEVELSAPGVGVLSTTPFKASSLTVGGNTYIGANIDGSARADVAGTLVGGGLCDATNGAWSGMVVLCQRGTNSFADKVSKVQSSGGLGAVIYNNVSGGFAGTLNGTSLIPAISISLEDGKDALKYLNQVSALANTAGTGSGYEYYDGTSMATPHVSGVAALVWSQNPNWTNAQIRDALQKTAIDKGSAGRDTSYGFGIVQASDALEYLQGGGTPPPANIALAVTKVKSAGKNFARLTWSGATSDPVDLYRGTSQGTSVDPTDNDGQEEDGPLPRGTYTYKVCNSGSTTCSDTVSVKF